MIKLYDFCGSDVQFDAGVQCVCYLDHTPCFDQGWTFHPGINCLSPTDDLVLGKTSTCSSSLIFAVYASMNSVQWEHVVLTFQPWSTVLDTRLSPLLPPRAPAPCPSPPARALWIPSSLPKTGWATSRPPALSPRALPSTLQ